MPIFARTLGILLTSAAVVVPPAGAQRIYDTTANPATDVARALEKARADRKLVLLDFGADWCPDCRVLDKLFADTSVAGYLGANFHVVRIDVGRWTRNLEFSKAYGSPIDSGIPAVVVLAPDGRIVASTKNGALATARRMTPPDAQRYLEQWVAAGSKKPVPPEQWPLARFAERDVAVEITLHRDSLGAMSLAARFTPVREGFYLYSTDLPPDGIDGAGRPTRLELVSSPAMTFTGPGVADRTVMQLPYPALGVSFPVYPAGPVTLRRPVKFARDGQADAELSVTYMTCSSSLCMPPVENKRFTVTLPAAATR